MLKYLFIKLFIYLFIKRMKNYCTATVMKFKHLINLKPNELSAIIVTHIKSILMTF